MTRYLLATDVLVSYLRDPQSTAATWLAKKSVSDIVVCGLSSAWILARSDAADIDPYARAAWRAQIAAFRGLLTRNRGAELGLDLATLAAWAQIFHLELLDSDLGSVHAEERFVIAQALAYSLTYVSPPRTWLESLATRNALIVEIVS